MSEAWRFGGIQAGNARYTAREERRTARAEEKSVRKQLAQGKTYRQIRGKHFIDSMEDAEKERYLEYWSTRDPEAMKEYQEFMANKKKTVMLPLLPMRMLRIQRMVMLLLRLLP